MRSHRHRGILTGAAMALVLALAGSAAAMDEAAIEAAIPMPEAAVVPPLSPTDVGAVAAPMPSVAVQAAPAAPVAAPKSEDTARAKEAAPAIATADQQIADKLRELVGSRSRRDRAALEAFYGAREFAPLWITDGKPNARAKAAIAHLAAADTDGLDPADYPTPDFKSAEASALADAELKLTNAALSYARHAQMGRVHFSRISSDISYNQEPPEPADILTKLAAANDVRGALASFNPSHPQYRALRAKLAEARGLTSDSRPAHIGHGPVLNVGMQDSRVPALRQRLGVAGEGDDRTYDKSLAEAVKRFQQQRRLSITGKLTGATVDALNGPRRDKDADIILANMERWRWMPRDLGKIHVIVNIPDYTLRVVRDGALYWSTKIVVGKPSQATPITTAMMQYITVNPTWNVPPSIIQNEYLPALQQDPTALERIGLKVAYNRDGTIHIYQPPGDRNALGRIRFNFPNKFLVYQHDTPDKHLFAQDKRAFSHGCMRVQDPLKYGEVILSLVSPKEGYTADRLRRMFGSAEQNINLPTHIPVHLTYQTALVDEHGKLVIREDIYGRDARMIAVLKGEERRVADIAVDRRPTTVTRPVRAPSGFGNGFGGGYYSGGPSFFDRLFGGAPPSPPVPPARVQRRAFR